MIHLNTFNSFCLLTDENFNIRNPYRCTKSFWTKIFWYGLIKYISIINHISLLHNILRQTQYIINEEKISKENDYICYTCCVRSSVYLNI